MLRRLPRIAALLLAALPPAGVSAQLRPLDPVPWEALDAARGTVRVGLGYHADVRASLAGTRGTLLELGNVTATWTLGRVTLELGGTVQRVFEDDSAYAEPVHGARPPDGERRTDTGEHRLGTIVVLTPEGSRATAVLRFGTRLPTTDNRQGLGRDQTDFFGLVGGRWRAGALALSAEAGVGILGTRGASVEQIDPLLYAVRVGWDGARVRLWTEAVGQHDTRAGPPLRGVEDLGELRAGAEVGSTRRARVVLVRGTTRHSPGLGVLVESSLRF